MKLLAKFSVVAVRRRCMNVNIIIIKSSGSIGHNVVCFYKNKVQLQNYLQGIRFLGYNLGLHRLQILIKNN